MRFKIFYNPEFQNDIQQAVVWYNEQKEGLGKRFFMQVKKQLPELKRDACNYAVRYDDVRCMQIKKSPYMVHFRLDYENSQIMVEAHFTLPETR